MSEDIRGGGVYFDLYARTEQLAAAGASVGEFEAKVVGASGSTASAMAQVSTATTRTAGALEKEAVAATEAASATQTAARAADQVAAASGRAAGSAGALGSIFGKTESAATNGHKALRKVEGGLVAVALSASDTSPAIGSIIQGLLLFGAGSTAVLGVAAAVAVLANGFALLTADERKTEEQAKKTREEIARLREEQKTPDQRATELTTSAAASNARALAEVDRRRRELEIAREAQLAGDENGLVNVTRAEENLTAAKEAQKKTQDDLNVARKNGLQVDHQSRVEELQQLQEAQRLGIGGLAIQTRQREVVAELRAIEVDATKPLKDRLEARKALFDLATAERDREKELRDIIIAGRDAAAQQTKNLTDNAQVALEQFDARAQDQIAGLNPADRARAQAALDAQRRFVVENVRAAQLLDQAGPASALNDFDSIDAKIQALIAGEQKLTEGGQAFEAVEKRIGELEERKTELMQNQLTTDKNRAAVEAQNEAKAKVAATRVHHDAEEQVKLITSAVRGALQLAEAFGLVGDATAKVLTDILTLANDLPALAKAISALQAGKGSTAAVVASALPVVGALAGLVSGLFGGDSAEEQARKEALRQNTAAITKLSNTVGELGLSGVTGEQFAKASQVVTAVLQPDRFFHAGHGRITDSNFQAPGVDNAGINAFLKSQGTSRQELQDLATSLGLHTDFLSKDINVLRASFEALDKALKATQLTEFAHTFAGQLDALRLQEQAFNITDPTQKLADLRDLVSQTGTDPEALKARQADLEAQLKALKQDKRGNNDAQQQAIQDELSKIAEELANPIDSTGSPALKRALAGLDLNTAEGRAQAQANLQQIVLALRNGTLNPSDLGALDGNQFKQAISDLLDLLNQSNQAANGGADTSSFSVARTITDNQADQLIGLGVSANVYLAEISANSLEIRNALSGLLLAFSGIQPPSLPAGVASATAGAGGTTLVIQGPITVTVTAAPGTDLTQLGAQAGQQVVDGLLASLGKDYQLRRFLAGQAGVS